MSAVIAGQHCELHSSSFKIGVHGLVFRHDGFEWKRSTVAREDVTLQTRKEIIRKTFSPTELANMRDVDPELEKAFLSGRVDLLPYAGSVAEYPAEWARL